MQKRLITILLYLKGTEDLIERIMYFIRSSSSSNHNDNKTIESSAYNAPKQKSINNHFEDTKSCQTSRYVSRIFLTRMYNFLKWYDPGYVDLNTAEQSEHSAEYRNLIEISNYPRD